jgi:formylglycine-generating enzyme required for sulfatase activity
MKKTLVLFPLMFLTILTIAQPHNKKGNYVKDPNGFVLVPNGNAEINGKSTGFNAFYVSETEVTNGQYMEFLNDLKKQGRTKDYETARIDTSLWKKYDESRTSYYDSIYHLKKDFPVVNISKEGAELFCKWLSEKFNNNKEGIIWEVRLPSNSEWEYAARGGLFRCPYPWGGPYPNTAQGCFLAQFRVYSLTYGPVEVKSFPANMWDLYDMSGNASEMVSDTNIVRGGSWNSCGYEIQIPVCTPYYVSPMVGFRPVATFIVSKDIKK